jgi:hypothetical protein
MNALKRIQMKLLEVNEKTTALSFFKEVQNLEFTEIIEGMDVYSCLNSRKRNEILVKIGKRLFKKQSVFNRLKNRKLKWTEVLSQVELDMRLNPAKYKRSNNRKRIYTKVLSQEEIDMLLIPLDNSSLHGRIIEKTRAILRSGIYYIQEYFKR